MKLDFLRYEKCPTCGSRLKSQTQKDLHTCGQWNEFQEFQCGCVLHWSPNFGQELVDRKCPQDPETVSKKAKRVEALRSLNEHIGKLEVDDDFRAEILEKLKYVGCYR